MISYTQTNTTPPPKDIWIIMGDLSAKVGIDWESWNGTFGKIGLGVPNDIGERMLIFFVCALNNLFIYYLFIKTIRV